MPGIGSNITRKKETSEPKKAVRALNWQKPDPDAIYGKNIGILGQPMHGKTNLALQLGFFNSKYKKYIKEAGYNGCLELLDQGVVSEVEKIIVLESENNLKKSLNDGVEKVLYKPFIDEGILDIIPIVIPRKKVVIRDGKVVDITTDLLRDIKEQYVETVKQVVDDEPESTLFIIDSASKFKKLLDDRLGTIIDKVQGRKSASLEGLEKYTQVFYSYRNTEWEDLMEYKRGFRGWNVDTFKETATPQHYVDAGAEPISTKWVNGTEFFLDVVYRVTAEATGKRKVEIYETNSRYLPNDPKEWKPWYLPKLSRMGGLSLIEKMSDKLLLGEQDPYDDKFWGV
ncbi:MAG: hypothetical protein GF364_18240 [Candidatus Lokiarchaeota archaeon]|nr:hypothetical protein [Candidatus Lokiarchaeota archaeon]